MKIVRYSLKKNPKDKKIYFGIIDNNKVFEINEKFFPKRISINKKKYWNIGSCKLLPHKEDLELTKLWINNSLNK